MSSQPPTNPSTTHSLDDDPMQAAQQNLDRARKLYAECLLHAVTRRLERAAEANPIPAEDTPNRAQGAA